MLLTIPPRGRFSKSDQPDLYLLKEHAEIEAKIQMPEDWKDPLSDR
jgi:hypothetical protein